MAFKYMSGEEIKPGDVISLHGKPAKIEFVVEGKQDDDAMNWYFTEHGGGIMIYENQEYGRLFIPADQVDINEYDFSNLKFVSRG